MLYTKREIKRKKLIKKLFEKALNAENLSGIKLLIQENRWKPSRASNTYKDNESEELIEQKIFINLGVFKDRLKNGYDDIYYPGRREKLLKISSNRHDLIRFIIFHELCHAKDRQNFLREDFHIKQNRDFWEGRADDLAIYHIENKTI